MPVLTPEQHEKEMHLAASSGDWDKAIKHAKSQPKNWSAFDKLPQYEIPPEAFEKVINSVPKNDRANFYFELASNLHPNLTHDQLDFLGSKTGNDIYAQDSIKNHPNWNPKESKKNLGEKSASDFWLSYERRVEPHHFATIKSIFSGKPEEITDHRGKTGNSHLGSIQNGRLYEKESNIAANGPKFYGDQFLSNLKDVHPYLLDHAKKVQDAIMQDENIEKRIINGKPHIKLYRGVGGSYAKRIAKSSKYDPKNHSVENKKFKIKSAPFSSWSTEKEVADNFAKSRTNITGTIGPAKPGESITLSSWIPVENILHSGFHRIHTGQEHAHPHESEIIVSHPTGYMNLNSKDLHLVNTLKDPYSSEIEKVSTRGIIPQKLAASEKEYFNDLLEKNLRSKIAAAALGASLLSTPANIKEIKRPLNQIQEKQTQLHPDLVDISAIESNYGKNKQHKKVLTGVNMGHKAAGATGLMPLTIKETIKRNKNLSDRYPQTISMDHDQLTDFINKNPNIENKIANAHYKKLLKVFSNNKNKAIFAWRNGISAAKNASQEEINNNPYVIAVNKAKININKSDKYFKSLKKTNTKINQPNKINKKFIAVINKGTLSDGKYNPSPLYYVGDGNHMTEPYKAMAFDSIEQGRKEIENSWKKRSQNEEYKRTAPHPFDISFIEDPRPGKWNEDESYYEDESGNPILDSKGNVIHAKMPKLEFNEPNSIMVHVEDPSDQKELKQKQKLASSLKSQGKKVDLVYPKMPEQKVKIQSYKEAMKEIAEQEAKQKLKDYGYDDEGVKQAIQTSGEKTNVIPEKLAASELYFKNLKKSNENKQLLNKWKKYFKSKIKKTDGITTTTMPRGQSPGQTGPSLNGTSIKEQPRGPIGTIRPSKDLQQISQSFTGNLGQPGISAAASNLRRFLGKSKGLNKKQ